MTILASRVQWSVAIIVIKLWITTKFTDKILHYSQMAMGSSCMQRYVAISIIMFWITFVLFDEILCNIKTTKLASRVQWSVAIIVTNLIKTLILGGLSMWRLGLAIVLIATGSD